jgi:hypothetical protein
LSAIVGAGASGFINYILNFKDFKKRSKIAQLEHKISLYSYLLFQLDRMRFTWRTMEDMGRLHKELNEKPSEEENYVYSHTDRVQIGETFGPTLMLTSNGYYR